MNIGIIGCGNIGTEIALFLDKKPNAPIISVSDMSIENAKTLVGKLKRNKPKIASIEETISSSDLIIEAASPEIVPNILLLAKNKKIFIMSVGGLLNQKITHNIFFPSGAIAGLDAIKAISMGTIESITLTTTKPGDALKNAPFVQKNKINLSTKKTIFSGRVDEAIRGFPTNINVAAALAISSGVPNKITVNIVVDPSINTNTHEIVIKSDSGILTIRAENIPSEKNPRTSQLAVYSALSTINSLLEHH